MDFYAIYEKFESVKIERKLHKMHIICILNDTYFKNTYILSTRHHFSKVIRKLFFSIYHLINTYNSPRAEKSLICILVEPMNFTQEELYTVSFKVLNK